MATPYPSLFGAAQKPRGGVPRSGGNLIQAVSRQPRGHPPPARNPLPTPRQAPRAPFNPRKPTLGPDVVQAPLDVPSAAGIGYGDGSSYQDPAIAQMQAMAARAAAFAARTRGEAQAEAAAKRKQATIEYGSAEGVPGIDAATAQAAANNPFSILAALQRNYTQGVGELEDQLNKANLFYGGYRGEQLGRAATGYQQQRYGAGTRYQATLADINSALTNALLNADMAEMQAGGGGGGGVEQTARPGEANPQGIEIVQAFDPTRNSDAKYNVGQLTRVNENTLTDGVFLYDNDGRRL